MIVDALIAGILVAVIAGGRLRHLADVDLRHTWLVICAALLQYGGQWLFGRGVAWVGAWGSVIYLASLAGVLVFVYLNRSLPGFKWAGCGVLLNALVIAANGGRMPVSSEAVRVAGLESLLAPLEEGKVITHALMADSTPLALLGDFIPLPHPYPRPKVISIGDIVLAVGAVTFAVVSLRPRFLGRRGAGDAHT